MKIMPLQKRGISDSRLALGCMPLVENGAMHRLRRRMSLKRKEL